MAGSSSWMPCVPQGVKGLYDRSWQVVPKASVRNYDHSLYNNPEKRSSQVILLIFKLTSLHFTSLHIYICLHFLFYWRLFNTKKKKILMRSPSMSTHIAHESSESLPSHFDLYEVTRRLTTEIRSEKCIVRQFCQCENVTERTYPNLDSTA